MANLPDSPSFDDVYQLEQTDPVDAGENGEGIANAQARNLANRTRYLKDAHEALDASLKPVAKSGNYADLENKPALGSAASMNAADFATAAQGAKADAALPASEKGAVNGVASLDAAGKVPAAQLPTPTNPMSVLFATDQAAMLALPAQRGDICKRMDDSTAWVLIATPSTQIENWLKLSQNLPTLGSAATADASDFATAAQGTLATNALPASEKGAVNGVASLDATGKVPAAQLPDFDASGKQDVLDALSLAFVNKGAGNTKVLREDGVWIDPPSGGGGGSGGGSGAFTRLDFPSLTSLDYADFPDTTKHYAGTALVLTPYGEMHCSYTAEFIATPAGVSFPYATTDGIINVSVGYQGFGVFNTLTKYVYAGDGNVVNTPFRVVTRPAADNKNITTGYGASSGYVGAEYITLTALGDTVLAGIVVGLRIGLFYVPDTAGSFTTTGTYTKVAVDSLLDSHLSSDLMFVGLDRNLREYRIRVSMEGEDSGVVTLGFEVVYEALPAGKTGDSTMYVCAMTHSAP